MKFTCSAQELLTGLGDAARALAARAPAPLLECLKLEAAGDAVTVTGSDGALTIRAHVRADVRIAGEALLPGSLLTEFARMMPLGAVVLETDDRKGTAMLRCGTSRLTLYSMPAAEYPEGSELEVIHTIQMPQKRLKDMIGRVLFAIAQKESRAALTGCLLEMTGNELRLVGVDGFRMAILKTVDDCAMTPAGTVNAVIPRYAIAEMSRLMTDDGKGDAVLRVAKGRILAEIGSATVTATLIGEQFINYRQILPQRWDTRVTAKTAELEQAIDRASLIAREGKNSLIQLTTEGDLLRVSSASDIGDTHEEIAATVQGQPLDIAFNSRYIGEAMKNIRDDCCTLEAEGDARPCAIKSADGEGDYLFLVLPVRNDS